MGELLHEQDDLGLYSEADFDAEKLPEGDQSMSGAFFPEIEAQQSGPEAGDQS